MQDWANLLNFFRTNILNNSLLRTRHLFLQTSSNKILRPQLKSRIAQSLLERENQNTYIYNTACKKAFKQMQKNELVKYFVLIQQSYELFHKIYNNQGIKLSLLNKSKINFKIQWVHRKIYLSKLFIDENIISNKGTEQNKILTNSDSGSQEINTTTSNRHLCPKNFKEKKFQPLFI